VELGVTAADRHGWTLEVCPEADVQHSTQPAAHRVSAPACKPTLFYSSLSGWGQLSTAQLLSDGCNKGKAFPLLSENPQENLRAAYRIWAKGRERVSLQSVWAPVKPNAGATTNASASTWRNGRGSAPTAR
jgi:hypothetical protein